MWCPDKRFPIWRKKNDVFGFWIFNRTVARREGEELHGAHPDSGEGDPPRAVGKGSPGVCPDRDREDRGLRASHPAEAWPGGGAGARARGPASRAEREEAGLSPRSRAGAHPHEGAGHPDRRELPRIREAHRPAADHRLRRGQPGAAGAGGAARMLDMGFIHDIRRLVDKLPPRRQSLFFSATIPGDIRRLADTILRDPVRGTVSPQAPAPEAVEHYLYLVEKPDKAALLQHLLADPALRNVLVFTRTRHGADRVARHLARARIPAEAIHGAKTQRAREQALSDFRRGKSGG